MTPFHDLTDQQWQQVESLLPELRPRSEARGRPLVDTRAVLNGVRWIIHHGATWSAMPHRYPSYQTCHRRFKAWHRAGVLKTVIERLHGEAGVGLLATMETRMRTHPTSRHRRARALPGAGLSANVLPAWPTAAHPFGYPGALSEPA